MPLKVIHVTAGNLFGGVENTLSILAQQTHWDDRLERRFAVCFEGRLAQNLRATGANLTMLGPVRVRYPWQILRARRVLREAIARDRVDAVICHMVWSLVIFGAVARRMRIPLVYWMHNVAAGQHWLERAAAWIQPDLAVVNSEYTAQTLAKLFKVPPPHVIIHPVAQISGRNLSTAERARVRAAAGVDDGKVVIIQVSRMEAGKGHSLHLEALALLKSIGAWHCWMVGGAQRPEEQDYLDRLQRKAAELRIAERVTFLGERADVAELLRAADIFCQPNATEEAFGVVFVEAMAAGLPVVGTAIGGPAEIVQSSCGRLVAPGDSEGLAVELRTLIMDPALRATLGRNGPARAASLSQPDSALTKLTRAIADVDTKYRRRQSAGEMGHSRDPAHERD